MPPFIPDSIRNPDIKELDTGSRKGGRDGLRRYGDPFSYKNKDDSDLYGDPDSEKMGVMGK